MFLEKVLISILQGAGQTEVNLPSEVKLDPIFIPTFIDFSTTFSALGGPASTVFSFISFLGVLATAGVSIFWVFRILKIGIDGLQSEGKPEKIQELSQNLINVLKGVFMSFLFPLILSIIGIFAGIGTIFEWPRMFRQCQDNGEYAYYFQAYLAAEGSSSQTFADTECGYL